MFFHKSLILSAAILVALAEVAAAQPPQYLLQWGSFGSGDGQFWQPYAVAVDQAGNVYVSDFGNQRVQKFDSNGVFLLKWGARGFPPLGLTRGIAVDPAGDVYVADTGNHCIKKFTSNGVFLLSIFGMAGQAINPMGVAADQSGKVWVTDIAFSHVQKSTALGTYLLEWGSACVMTNGSTCYDPDGDGPLELGDGQFHEPRGIGVDPAGNVYVADALNHRIQKFDSTGTFIRKWGTLGPNVAELNAPSDVAVDPRAHVIVADAGNGRLQMFDSNGEFILSWGSPGSGDGEFNEPRGVAVDPTGQFVYVADMLNHRIQKFTNAVGTDADEQLFNSLSLSSFPNPSTRRTWISYNLPKSSPVSIVIYDAAGRCVRQWAWATVAAGQHVKEWNGLSDAGQVAPSGVYFYQVTAGGQAHRQKMVHLQ